MKVLKETNAILLTMIIASFTKGSYSKVRVYYRCTNTASGQRATDATEQSESTRFIESTPKTIDMTNKATTAKPTTVDNVSSGYSSTISYVGTSADCFVPSEDVIILNGTFHVSGNCTMRFTCTNGVVELNERYNCSPNAVCATRDNVHKCYCINGYHGDGKICSQGTSCHDAFNGTNTTNGIYTIKPINWNGSPFEVFCNMDDEGIWTVFQRRVDGCVDFYRGWASYKHGFGEVDHEFWLGNEKLYYLTNQGNYTLRIELVVISGARFYADYDFFRINDESDNYRLSELGAYSGTAGDDLTRHKNNLFTTFDKDNDEWSASNCAVEHHGAWWHENCISSNLNGEYLGPPNGRAIYWDTLNQYTIVYTEMKIRPSL